MTAEKASMDPILSFWSRKKRDVTDLCLHFIRTSQSWIGALEERAVTILSVVHLVLQLYRFNSSHRLDSVLKCSWLADITAFAPHSWLLLTYLTRLKVVVSRKNKSKCPKNGSLIDTCKNLHMKNIPFDNQQAHSRTTPVGNQAIPDEDKTLFFLVDCFFFISAPKHCLCCSLILRPAVMVWP